MGLAHGIAEQCHRVHDISAPLSLLSSPHLASIPCLPKPPPSRLDSDPRSSRSRVQGPCVCSAKIAGRHRLLAQPAHVWQLQIASATGAWLLEQGCPSWRPKSPPSYPVQPWFRMAIWQQESDDLGQYSVDLSMDWSAVVCTAWKCCRLQVPPPGRPFLTRYFKACYGLFNPVHWVQCLFLKDLT